MSNVPPHAGGPIQQKSWFARNWIWMLILLIVLLLLISIPCIVCGGGLAGIMSFAEKIGEPVEATFEAVRENTEVQEKLGMPVSKQTGFQNSSINNNDANVTFDVFGPDGKATVEGELYFQNEKWTPSRIVVKFSDGTQTVISK